jgi:hypothetical protein
LTGAEVNLLSDETVQKLICYSPKDPKSTEHYTIGHLLGAADNQIPFTVNVEKLLHYHVGAFAFTGSGKSNLTSLIIRKAMNSVLNVKFVIFDISSEYGINILDLLRSFPSRIVLTEPLPVHDSVDGNNNHVIEKMAEDYIVRHVVPEALVEVKQQILESVKEIILQDKIRTLTIPSESEQIMLAFSTYGGVLRSLADLTNEKFGAAGQKVLIPAVVNLIKKFMKERRLNEDSLMGSETKPLIKSILDLLSTAKLRADAAILSIFNNLLLALEDISPQTVNDDVYDTTKLVNEILDKSTDAEHDVALHLALRFSGIP